MEQLGSPATAKYGHRANGTNVDRPMTRGIVIGRAAFVLGAWLLLGASTEAPDFSAAARAMDATIEREYAYSEKLPGGALPRSAHLDAERAAVHDETSLLHYAEDRMISLADHHAITGSSFKDSWAVVPTYADVWVVARGGKFVVDAVRDHSPAASAGIEPGNQAGGRGWGRDNACDS